jgi:hypothetical protein
LSRDNAAGGKVALRLRQHRSRTGPDVDRNHVRSHGPCVTIDGDVVTGDDVLRAFEARHAFTMTLTNRLGSDHRSTVGADHFCIVSENPTEVRRIEVLLIERAKVAVHHLLNLDDLLPLHRITSTPGILALANARPGTSLAESPSQLY